MYLVLLFATTALLGTGRSANINKHMKLLSDLDNNVESNELPTKQTALRPLLAITHRPLPKYSHTAGTALELKCSAFGTPAPSIHWFKNDAPVYEYDVESNELIDGNPSSVAQVVSTLLITRTVGRDVYSCRVTAGFNTASATTVVFGKDDSTALSERAKLFPLKPRIVVSYETYMDYIGSNIVLPCRVKGHPKPHVTWTDLKGTVLNNNPRMKVLRSGELVITGLSWDDMGEFTCFASNVFGTATAKTFVYPTLED